MKLIFLAIVLTLQSLISSSQETKAIITGKITDSTGYGLSHVQIIIEGTNQGTFTDENGNYKLKANPGNYFLIVKLIGYEIKKSALKLVSGETTKLSLILSKDKFALQEVIISSLKIKSVTATKTLMELQDIPQSITVIGQKTIKQQAIFDLSTLSRNITGLNFSGNYSGAGSSQFFNARGFDLNDSQNYRLNGIMIWNLGNNYSDNIEQVEFLKGPSSILFGDVTPGGVINFVTKKPLAEFRSELNFKTGSWGLLRPSLDITGPLNKSKTLKYRVNTSVEQMNSFRDQVSPKRSFIAPTFNWDITNKLSLNLESVYKSSSAVDDAGLVSPDGTIEGLKNLRPNLYLGDQNRSYLYKDLSNLMTAKYDLGKTWKLKASMFYGITGNRPFGLWFDQPNSQGDFARRSYGYYQRSGNSSASIESNGEFYTGKIKHNLLLGADYQSTSYRYTNEGSLTVLDTSNLFTPINNKIVPLPTERPFRPYVSLITRNGIYIQDQLMLFMDKLQLLVGIRAGQTRQGNHYFQNLLGGTDFEGYVDNIISKNVISPRLGLVYKANQWTSVYGSWSEGYEINSPDIFAQNFLEFASPPITTSNQLELGIKSHLFSHNLGLSLSVFEINKQNPYGYVYLDPINPNYEEYNVYYEGHHRSRGLEADFDGKLTSEISLTAGLAYNITSVINDPGYPAGNVLPNAPRYSSNIWVNYEPQRLLKGLSAGAGLFYKDKFFSTLSNDPNLIIPAGYTMDLSLGYQHKKLGAQLNVMNFTNRINYLNPWQFNLFEIRPMRQFVITLTYQINPRRNE
jgi:iron complex outermembrane recepter protein